MNLVKLVSSIGISIMMLTSCTGHFTEMQSKKRYIQDEEEMAEKRDWMTLQDAEGHKIQVAYYQGDHPINKQNSILVDVIQNGKLSQLYPSNSQAIYTNGKINLKSLDSGSKAEITQNGVTKIYSLAR